MYKFGALGTFSHDEDISGWSAKIKDYLAKAGGSMAFWSIVDATGLAPVEVLLGLLLGSGYSMKRSGAGGAEDFYWGSGVLVLGGDTGVPVLRDR
jgi:hypothetical protein